MKDANALRSVLAETRNGANSFYRHPLTPAPVSLVISDGAEEAAEAAGCYWLINTIAIKYAAPAMDMIQKGEAGNFYVMVRRADGERGCTITIELGESPVWTEKVEFTNFPEGEWFLFVLGYWGEDRGRGNRPALCLCLPSED